MLALGGDTLRLGPVQIAANDVYDVTLTTQEEDISLLKFGVEKSLASVIAAYTESIVGSELEIYIGDRLVNSVKVPEAVNGTNMAIAMKSELAEQAYQSLNFASD